MENQFYNRYKATSAATQKRKSGKICLIVGILMVIGALLLLPYHAKNVNAICGDELKVRDAYYIEDLQILDAQIKEDGKTVYCLARFTDKNQNDWFISFQPRNNEHLVNQINLAKRLGTKPDLTTSGYVYVDDIPSAASAFYAVRCKSLSDQGEENILELHADYLCSASGNFILEALLRPSLIKQAFVWGVIGILFSILILFKYRKSKFQ